MVPHVFSQGTTSSDPNQAAPLSWQPRIRLDLTNIEASVALFEVEMDAADRLMPAPAISYNACLQEGGALAWKSCSPVCPKHVACHMKKTPTITNRR
jgi:hypothetical protein